MLFQNLSPSPALSIVAVFRHRRLPAGRVCRRCAQRPPEPREFPYRARDRAVAVLPDRRAHLVSPHRRCQLPRGAWRRHLPDRGRLRRIRQRHVREPSGLYRHARQSGFAVRRTPRIAARDHHPWRRPAGSGMVRYAGRTLPVHAGPRRSGHGQIRHDRYFADGFRQTRSVAGAALGACLPGRACCSPSTRCSAAAGRRNWRAGLPAGAIAASFA